MLKEVQPGFAIWLTGLPSSGKSTLAQALSCLLAEHDIGVQLLDSDDLRRRLTPNPTYSDEEREWFYDMVTFLAGLLTDNGLNVIIAATAPRQAHRQAARDRIARFTEVYVDCSPEECRARDPKGLWEGADKGEITTLPGAGVAYESPASPEIHIDTTRFSAEEAAHQILDRLGEHGYFASHGHHLDGSPLSGQALWEATTLAQKLGSEIILLRVLGNPIPLPPTFHPELESGWMIVALSCFHRGAQRYLNTHHKQVRQQGSEVRILMCDQSAAKGILEVTNSEGADLVFMNDQGQGEPVTLPGGLPSRVGG